MVRNVKQQGFTLLEAMIVVAILGILASLAYPSFQATLARNRAQAAEMQFSKALAYARSEAISRNQTIALCPIDSGKSHQCGGSKADWSKGIYVFSDRNQNNKIDKAGDILQVYYLKPPVSININQNITRFIWLPGGIRFNADHNLNNGTISFIPSQDGESMKEQKKECTIIASGRLLCS